MKGRTKGARPNLNGLEKYFMFCLVGCTGLLVDMCVLFMLASESMLGLSLTLSKIIAAEVAILNNFILNELWTFKQSNRNAPSAGRYISKFLSFNVICVTGVVLSLGLLNGQVVWLHMNRYIANFNAIVLVSLWNFLWTLKSRSITTTPTKPTL